MSPCENCRNCQWKSDRPGVCDGTGWIRPSRFKKVWASFKAAVTSPEAVKQERSLAALIIFRLLLTLGASVSLAEVISKLVHG